MNLVRPQLNQIENVVLVASSSPVIMGHLLFILCRVHGLDHDVVVMAGFTNCLIANVVKIFPTFQARNKLLVKVLFDEPMRILTIARLLPLNSLRDHLHRLLSGDGDTAIVLENDVAKDAHLLVTSCLYIAN